MVRLLSDILRTAQGTSNSRRGRATLSSGTKTALRYTRLLLRDLERLLEQLKDMQGRGPVHKKDPVQLQYFGKITAELVYTYVATDLVK